MMTVSDRIIRPNNEYVGMTAVEIESKLKRETVGAYI